MDLLRIANGASWSLEILLASGADGINPSHLANLLHFYRLPQLRHSGLLILTQLTPGQGDKHSILIVFLLEL